MNNSKVKYTIVKGNIFYLNFRVPSYKTIRISLQTDSKKQAQLVIDNITPLILKIKQVGLTMKSIDQCYPLIPPQTTINTLVMLLTLEIKGHANHVLFPTSSDSLSFKEDYNSLLDDLDINAEEAGVSEEYSEAFIDTCRNKDVEASLEYLRSDKMGVLDTLWSNDDPFYDNAKRALGFLNQISKEIAELLDAYSYEPVKEKLKLLQKYSDKLNGIKLEHPQEKIISVEKPETPSTPLFSQCIQDYIAANTGNKGNKWQPKILSNNTKSLGILLEAIGDKPVGEITDRWLDEVFENIIKGLPKTNKNPYRNMNYKLLVDCVHGGNIENKDVIAAKTVHEYRKLLQGLFSYLCDKHIIETSPTKAMRCKTQSNVKRGMFTNPETRDIYNYCIKQDKLYKKWCIPLMIYTGCRNNEIVQLTKNDVKTCRDTGIRYIHVNGNDGKSIKNNQSIRSIPIHQDLVDAGFLDFVEAQKSELFPQTTSKTLTRFYQVIKKNLNLPTEDEKGDSLTLYSTRHRFITTIYNVTGSESLTGALAGHSPKPSVTNKNYFKGFELPALKDALDKFKF